MSAGVIDDNILMFEVGAECKFLIGYGGYRKRRTLIDILARRSNPSLNRPSKQ
jgi:hypothetical protein